MLAASFCGNSYLRFPIDLRRPPAVSLVLATWAKDYLDGLAATRYRGPVTGKAAQVGLNVWVGTFAGACRRAVDDAASFEVRVEQIQREWRTQQGASVAGLLPTYC